VLCTNASGSNPVGGGGVIVEMGNEWARAKDSVGAEVYVELLSLPVAAVGPLAKNQLGKTRQNAYATQNEKTQSPGDGHRPDGDSNSA